MHQWLTQIWTRIRQYSQARPVVASMCTAVRPTSSITRRDTGCLFFITDDRRRERLRKLVEYYAHVYVERVVVLTDDAEFYNEVTLAMGTNHWFGHLMPEHLSEKEWAGQSHLLFERIVQPGPMIFILHMRHAMPWCMAWLTEWIDDHHVTQFFLSHPSQCAYVEDIMNCSYGWPYWSQSNWSSLVTQYFAKPLEDDAKFWRLRTYQLYLAFNTIRLRWFSNLQFGDYHDLRHSESLDFWITQMRRQPSSFVGQVLHKIPGVADDFSTYSVQSREQFRWLHLGWINPRRLSIVHYHSSENAPVLHPAQSEQWYMGDSYYSVIAMVLML